MANLLDMAEKVVEITLAGEKFIATQLFIDDWIELSRQGYELADITKTTQELDSEIIYDDGKECKKKKNIYELRKLIVWRGIRGSCPDYKAGFPEGIKVSLIEMTIAARKILELENLAVPGEMEVMTGV